MRACDYKVFFIEYTDRVQHRNYSNGDSEFSHWEYNVPMKYICTAPTKELALAAFARYHNGEHVKNVEIKNEYTLNDMVYLQ